MSDRGGGTFSEGNLKSVRFHNLEKQVCDALARDSRVDASQVGVALDAATGDLTLFGSVPSTEQRHLAEDCAAAVRGVHVVHNRLTIAKNKAD